jgi:2-aminoethylphosphonate-pyruvate transaminase
MTSDAVRQAAAMPDMNHREPAFVEMFDEVRTRLLSLYPGSSAWRACLLGGSGTAAVEAMVSSCIADGPVLVLTNGYYSERVVDLVGTYGIPYTVLAHEWLEAWDFDRIEGALKIGGFEAVLCVQNETTTGRLNDIARLGAMCRRYGALCLVDAMSSFGVEAIDFSLLDAVASSANKCLHGIPGVSFVLLSPSVKLTVRNYYLSLVRYVAADTPLTPPVPAIASLRQALRETKSVAERRASYSTLSTLIRTELQARSFEPAIPLEESSITLTTYRAPNGNAVAWIEKNREQGFLLYGCKGELRDSFFQVANMGELSAEDIHRWLQVVDHLLLDQ